MPPTIQPLTEADLDDADRIFRLAFGTFIGLPEPSQFMGDADLVKGRWHAAPQAALGAWLDGRLVGSNFAANWGSFGFFGPLTVHPDLWNRGIAQALLDATMPLFDNWGIGQAALFTFPDSAKHVALYQRYGFWPQTLTAIMAKPVRADLTHRGTRLSTLDPAAMRDAISSCRAIAATNLPGLDLTGEIQAVQTQQLGDTVLLDDAGELVGFAICHVGAGTEAGSGTAYIKFGAVRSDRDSAERFVRLLAACEAFAAEQGATQLHAGVSTARHGAYRAMLDNGFRTFLQGIAMHRPNASAHSRADCFVIDDWR